LHRQPLPAKARQLPRKLIQSEAGSRKSPPFTDFDAYIGPLLGTFGRAKSTAPRSGPMQKRKA